MADQDTLTEVHERPSDAPSVGDAPETGGLAAPEVEVGPASIPPIETRAGEEVGAPEGDDRPVNVLLTGAAAFLASSAAGWMCAGIFVGATAKVVAFIGPIVGAGIVVLSYRTQRPSLIQYLALPASIVVGAAFVLPDTTGTASLPNLVEEAIRGGGVAQPPVPFDPGWRFILVVLTAVVAAASASLATGLNRPKLGVLAPTPVVFGVALLQPVEGAVLTTGVALVLLISALAVAYGVELQREGATSGEFEARRLVRGAGTIVLLAAALWALSRAGFLFPDVERDQVVPPKRPEVQPPQADRVVFTVEADRPGPWRVGVLDVYQDSAWMLPPFDPARFQEIPPSGVVPAPERAADDVPPPTAPREVAGGAGSFVARFEVTDLGGHVLPTIADARSVRRDDGFAVTDDPRTGMLRLPNARARQGLRYTVEAPPPPTAQEMAEASRPPDAFAATFTQAPPPPAEVEALLAGAPLNNPFARLQFVRTRFYENVVAAGSGQPVDLSPGRVVEMLEGGEGSPYEIAAAEALLARWAGIPARVGYGYHAGDRSDAAGPRTFAVRPKHGATWLEAYFHGYGWVPIVGTPPQAKASLSESKQEDDPEIRPTEELALVVYAPVTLRSLQPLFVVVRYWAGVALVWLTAFGLMWSLYPGVLKVARRIRRRRWGSRHGLAERIMVAYAEFRDAANDLNLGDPAATPLEFIDAIERDAEHRELGWLVSRALWGDLHRDLRREDAEAAEDMAASLTRRLRRAAPAITRLLAFGSRVSLRDPYTDQIPNLWPGWARPGVVRETARRGVASFAATVRAGLAIRRIVPRRVGVLVLVALAVTLGIGGCGRAIADPTAGLVEPVLPDPIVPARLDGLTFSRERDAERAYELVGDEGLVGEGRVFTLRDGDDVTGALQVGAFKPDLKATEREIREGVLNSIGTGNFTLTRIGSERVFVQQLAEQRIFLWFPPRMQYFELLVAGQGFEGAERLFTGVLAFQRGEELDRRPPRGDLPDPRRGAPA